MNFAFWVKYLKVVSIFLFLLGVFWSIAGSFDPFGLYDQMFAKSFWNSDALPPDVERTKSFLLGPFGATSAGYFLLQYFISRYAYAQRQLWAYYAIVYAFSFWFILDTCMSLVHGAHFNILLANIPSLIMMAPIFLTRKYFIQEA